MGNFSIDKGSKLEFVALLKRLFKHIEIDMPDNPQSRLDLFATAFTPSGKVIKTYAFELKERWGKYTSDRYGKDTDSEGWIYERGKKDSLFEAYSLSGYTPIYVNLYPDNVIRIWDMSEYSDFVTMPEKVYKKHTVDNEGGRYRECKLTLMNRYGKEYSRYS